MKETQAPRAPKKSKFGGFLKIALIILMLTALALSLWYLLDRRSGFDYLPESFTAYVQVPSIRRVYDEWIDLKVAEAVLESAGMAEIRKALIDFRGSSISKSNLFRSLIDMRADIMILNNGELLAAFDLGPRSLLTRMAPAIGPFLSLPGLSYTKKDSFSYFEYQVGQRTFFASPAGNLLIVSSSARVLGGALALKGGSGSFSARADSKLLSSLSREGRGLRFLAEPNSLIQAPLQAFKQGKALEASMEFPREALADIDLSNQGAALDVDIGIKARIPELESVLFGKRPESRVLEILPQDASFMVGFTMPSLRSLFDLANALEPKLAQTLSAASDASRVALGMSFEDLLFSWAGGELGMMQVASSRQPIVYVSVRNEKRREAVFEKILGSALLAPQKKEIDGVSLIRLSFPWYIKALFQIGKVDFEVPYLGVAQDFIFFSQDPQALAACLASIEGGNLLSNDAAAFKNWRQDAIISSYFDSRERPFFLSGADPLSAAFAQYGRGFLQLWPQKDSLALALRASPSTAARPQSLAGFPLKLESNIESLAAGTFLGQSSPRIIVSGPTTIRYIDPNLSSKPLIFTASGLLRFSSGSDSFWSVHEKGVGLWTKDGPIGQPFPLSGEGLEATTALILGEDLLIYNAKENRFHLLRKNGQVQAWGPELEDPVLSAPVLQGQRLAFATKGFEALLYLCDLQGSSPAGWPQNAGGISYGSPALSRSSSRVRTAYLSQAGLLTVFEADGKIAPSFPLDLERIFYASPIYLRRGEKEILACLDVEGRLSLIGPEGSDLGSILASATAGKTTRILANDINDDGMDEIFIYGSGGAIYAFDQDGMSLAGFPQPGNLDIAFADIDNDGKQDLISVSSDGSLYAASLAPLQGRMK